MSNSVYQAVRLVDKKCRFNGCHSRSNLHVHHIIPRSQGGKDTADNLICLCQHHHQEIHAGNISNLDLLVPLKKKRGWRWQKSYEWWLAKQELKEIVLE